MAKFALILAAAGKSSRFRRQKKKTLTDLQGRAVWLRAIEPFVALDEVVQKLVVVAADDLSWFKEKYQANLAFMDIQVVAGGAERSDSVQQALEQVDSSVDFVAVHDGARPLITREMILSVFDAAEKSGAAIPAVPLASTIKRVQENQITETVPRKGLWAAQTPQVIRRDWLVEAYAAKGDFNATDEAQLIENLGRPVHVVDGSSRNIKITTGEDLQLARALLQLRRDVESVRPLHPFADEKRDLFS